MFLDIWIVHNSPIKVMALLPVCPLVGRGRRASVLSESIQPAVNVRAEQPNKRRVVPK